MENYLHDKLICAVSPLWRLSSLSTATKKSARKRRSRSLARKQQRVPENASRMYSGLTKLADDTVFVAGSRWSAVQAHQHSKSRPVILPLSRKHFRQVTGKVVASPSFEK